jgi:septal ring factor EnvC (AmiA/AmiB activator)
MAPKRRQSAAEKAKEAEEVRQQLEETRALLAKEQKEKEDAKKELANAMNKLETQKGEQEKSELKKTERKTYEAFLEKSRKANAPSVCNLSCLSAIPRFSRAVRTFSANPASRRCSPPCHRRRAHPAHRARHRLSKLTSRCSRTKTRGCSEISLRFTLPALSSARGTGMWGVWKRTCRPARRQGVLPTGAELC